MNRRILKLVILMGVLSLALAASAQAMNHGQAINKANGWQHYVCVADGGCLSWNAFAPRCTNQGGIGGTRIQWDCRGYNTTTLCPSHAREVESDWNAYGGLIHNWQGCEPTIP